MKPAARALTVVLGASLLASCGFVPGLNPPPSQATPGSSSSPTGNGSPTPSNTGLLRGIGAGISTAATSAAQSVSASEKELEGKLEAHRQRVQQAVDDISPQDERAEGQAASFKVIQQSGGLLLDERLNRYVNQVANLVGQHGTRIVGKRTGKPRTRARRFVVGVLNDASLNAFALPGGYIFVTRGLMEKLTCEADLAWVLGHEEAHVDREHGLAALKAEVSTTAVLKELGIGGDTTFKSNDFFGKIAGKLAELALKPHSQLEEEEADRIGLASMIAAGYDPSGARRVLQVLDASGSQGGGGHADPHSRFEKLKPEIDSAHNAGSGAGKLEGAARYDREGAERLEASLAAVSPPAATSEEWSK